MALAEIIKQFHTSHLRGIYIDLAHQVYDFPKEMERYPYIGGEDYYPGLNDGIGTHKQQRAEHIQRSWKPFPHIKQVLESTSTESYVEGIQQCLGDINEARARQILDDVNKSGIYIDADEHLRLALVLAFIQKDGLEDIAIANNISIPSDSGSGLGSFMRGASRDKGKWALIKKLTSELIVIESNVEEGIHYFCPHCKEDNPKEADHCISCGRELPQITCSKCETANPPQAKFCMGCGEER